MDQGIYLLYPNLFVVLVGPPGRCGKSTAIRLARQLLYSVPGVNIGPDSVTREELIRILASSHVEGQSALTIHSTELSSILDPSGIRMIQFLTDIYDCDPKKWRYSTKGSGRDEIQAPFLALLSATTPAYIAEGLPENVVGAGFTARVIFVYEEKERFLNPSPGRPLEALVEALTEDLTHISQLKGEFRWEGASAGTVRKKLLQVSEVYQEYDKYYHSLYDNTPSDHRIEGFHFRKRVHVLKIAMLCALAEKDDLVITLRDFRAAREVLELVEPKMARTFMAVGKYEHAVDLERLHHQVIEAGRDGVNLKELYRRNYSVGSLSVLDEMVNGLIAMGRVFKEMQGKDTIVKAKVVGELWED